MQIAPARSPVRSTAPGRIELPGTGTALEPNATFIDAVAPNARIDVTVRLRPKEAIPDAYVGGSRDAFERRHGAKPDDIAGVAAFAKSFGLDVGDVDAAQRTMTLSGTAAAMQTAFGVDLAEYHGAGGTYRGRAGAITVPAAIAPAVDGVFGLDERAASESHAIAAGRNDGARGFTPLDAAKAYRFPAGDGSGEHVAVISLGGRYDDRVQAAYCKALGVAHVPFHVVNVDGGAQNPSDAGPTGENMLDAEMIGALVPEADKTMYIAPNTDRGFLDAISTALHDGHRNTAISISWGGPEERFAPQAMRAFDTLFKEARAMGVNVFCAAGDNGSSDGVRDGRDHVDFPASSPSVIASGGTKLVTAADGSIARETVWNELARGEGATGGGVSAIEPKPRVQKDIPVAGRGVPDVAGNADPLTGFTIFVPSGSGGKAVPEVIGGTSAVSPLYAALAARLEANVGHPIGDLQKAIYDAPATAFHDVTSGTNGSYRAGPGWDAVTGRGSIDGTALLASLRSRAGA